PAVSRDRGGRHHRHLAGRCRVRRGRPGRFPGGAGLIISFLAASLLASPLSAQVTAADSSRAPTDVGGAVYDRPFLTNLLGRTAIGGYVEAQTRWEQVDGVRDGLGFQ